MHLTVTEAKAQLTNLVKRAEAGEDVVLTRHGHAIARLVAVRPRLPHGQRCAVIGEIRARASAKLQAGPPAANSQDFLYDEHGLPA